MGSSNVVIIGASSGLGAGMAREFARRGHDLGLCARRLDRLETLKAELESTDAREEGSDRELGTHQCTPAKSSACSGVSSGHSTTGSNSGHEPNGTPAMWASARAVWFATY